MNNKILNKLSDFVKKYHLSAFKDVALFMIILLVFHILWKVLVRDLMTVAFIHSSSQWLSVQVYIASQWFLELVNVNVTSFDEITIGEALRERVFYYAENNGYVSVNLSCSGLKQFYQWFFLMVLYPGPCKHKLWFIPLGLAVIHIVNIGRIVGMVYVTINIPDQWNLMHDYVMRPFFYVVMFFLWVWWNEKFYLKFKARNQA